MHHSITRLRLRSWRFLPAFAWHAIRSQRQALSSPGCRRSLVRATGRMTYWTLTSWDDEASMRAFITSGAHRKAMPHLQKWCDEASSTHWPDDAGTSLPDWNDAEARLASSGKVYTLRHASPAQAKGQPLGEPT
ncbi:MAG: DUF3291 domain-containing protein [Phycisphaerales bacterium]|jgi:hypothetical protein|nr:DUF3291 domain-containing protein [Phycisphaerales bacterium]